MDSNGFYTIVDMKNLNIDQTQIVIAGAVAETFLGVQCRDFTTSHQLRQEVTNKLKSLEGKPAEFCVEKIRQSVVLYAANSVIRF